jgi:hypothetical protein
MSAHAVVSIQPEAPSFVRAEAPAPVKQCNGTWRVPEWTPDRGWELVEIEPENSDEVHYGRVTSAACGDPECQAFHAEDFLEETIRQTKERLLASRARRAAEASGAARRPRLMVVQVRGRR